jgi:hypothetical protein
MGIPPEVSIKAFKRVSSLRKGEILSSAGVAEGFVYDVTVELIPLPFVRQGQLCAP